MKIGIISNKKTSNSLNLQKSLSNGFEEVSVDYDILNIDELKPGYDFICAIGGDGTILKASRYYAKSSTPVMGINSGRLGFLSVVSPKDIEKLPQVIKDKTFETEERMMLKSLNSTALNDIVIKGHTTSRTSKFDLYINNSLVSDYIADGIIVATPTGSTAYGLSAGGPVIHPELDAMVIVPICAHTMTARPLVVPATEKITIKSSDDALDVCFDGQEKYSELKSVDIERSEYRAKLAFPKRDDFYTVLKNKLHWGISPISDI